MVQEILQMSRISLAAVSVGRRSLIGACSFRLINSRKGCKKGKDIGIDTKKRRCSVRNRPRRNDLRGDKLRQHAWRRKIVCKEDGELRRSDHVKVEHAWTSDCVQCVCDTAQKKSPGSGIHLPCLHCGWKVRLSSGCGITTIREEAAPAHLKMQSVIIPHLLMSATMVPSTVSVPILARLIDPQPNHDSSASTLAQIPLVQTHNAPFA